MSYYEWKFFKSNPHLHEVLCPIYFYFPGVITVMRRVDQADHFTNQEVLNFFEPYLPNDVKRERELVCRIAGKPGFGLELKSRNVGLINGSLVLVDYPNTCNPPAKINTGGTRIVYLISAYAIKIPKGFYLDNIQQQFNEQALWKQYRSPVLCPIIFSIPGILTVMRRANPIGGENIETLVNLDSGFLPVLGIHAENCGILDGKLVIIDYGQTSAIFNGSLGQKITWRIIRVLVMLTTTSYLKDSYREFVGQFRQTIHARPKAILQRSLNALRSDFNSCHDSLVRFGTRLRKCLEFNYRVEADESFRLYLVFGWVLRFPLTEVGRRKSIALYHGWRNEGAESGRIYCHPEGKFILERRKIGRMRKKEYYTWDTFVSSFM